MIRKPWTDEESRKLAELWPDMDKDQVALMMGRTAPSCAHQARKLGVRKSDAYIKMVRQGKRPIIEKQSGYGKLIKGARVYLMDDRPKHLEERELKPAGRNYVSGSTLSEAV